jgi:hypothetical protein
MKKTFQILIAPVMLASSLAFAQDSSIQKAVPEFFGAGQLTTIALSGGSLPSSYADFVQYVTESFGPDSVTYGPEKYGTNADEICSHDPSGRACVHARYFQRIDEVPHAYRDVVAKYPERSYRKYDVQTQVLQYSAQYPMTKQVYIADNEAILFSSNDAKQAKMVSVLRQKLANSQHQLAVVYQVGLYGALPEISAQGVPSTQVRIVDADCGFLGTPEEYLANQACK